jgi:hypothetical protein
MLSIEGVGSGDRQAVMSKKDEFQLYSYGAGIVVFCFVLGALLGEAPAGFFIGCVAAVCYWRFNDE